MFKKPIPLARRGAQASSWGPNFKPGAWGPGGVVDPMGALQGWSAICNTKPTLTEDRWWSWQLISFREKQPRACGCAGKRVGSSQKGWWSWQAPVMASSVTSLLVQECLSTFVRSLNFALPGPFHLPIGHLIQQASLDTWELNPDTTYHTYYGKNTFPQNIYHEFNMDFVRPTKIHFSSCCQIPGFVDTESCEVKYQKLERGR